jgi:hypothetical protein
MLREWSPDLHTAVDDDVDTGDARALVCGQEQRDVGHLLRPAEAAQQRLAEHVARPFRIIGLRSRRVALDQTSWSRIGGGSHVLVRDRRASFAVHGDESLVLALGVRILELLSLDPPIDLS